MAFKSDFEVRFWISVTALFVLAFLGHLVNLW